MKDILRRTGRTLKRLHRDEGGSEGLEKLLILAAIVLPLLILLITFRDRIATYTRDLMNEVLP